MTEMSWTKFSDAYIIVLANRKGGMRLEKSLILCDVDTTYARAFASYMMEHIPNIHISIFTTEESFYADDQDYDYGILSKEFIEIASFKQKSCIKALYYLSEETDSDEMPFPVVNKYQDMEAIIHQIKGLAASTDMSSKRNKEKEAVVTGVYSPISHELQLPFAMSLGQIYKDKERVIFLDLEEISILNRLIEGNGQGNLMDLLYKLQSDNGNNLAIEDYVVSYMGIDYIPSFIGPEDINEINGVTYQILINQIRKLGYDRIIVLFGRAVSGFSDILSTIDQLIVVSKPGDYYRKSCDVFLQYLQSLNVELDVSTVLLPMTASNLADGTYCIEELLQGNLGAFVRQVVAYG